MTIEKTIREIAAFINNNGGDFSRWYAGVTSDYKERLFNDHKVAEKGIWVCHSCHNSQGARKVEGHLIKVLGCRGGQGGGDFTARYVYAYKITPHTIQTA